LEQQAENLWQNEGFPITIVKQESGFSLATAQQALAELLRHPNLAVVLVLDCRFDTEPSLLKMINDAGIPNGNPTISVADTVTVERIDEWLGQFFADRHEFFGRTLIGRSSLQD
jgi:hypothetical protein